MLSTTTTHHQKITPPTMRSNTLLFVSTILARFLSSAITANGSPSAAEHSSETNSCIATNDDDGTVADAGCPIDENTNDVHIEDHDDNGSGGCRDDHPECEFWGSQGECANNPNYMLLNCKKTCDTCNEIIT